jgi:hypothetical protein
MFVLIRDASVPSDWYPVGLVSSRFGTQSDWVLNRARRVGLGTDRIGSGFGYENFVSAGSGSEKFYWKNPNVISFEKFVECATFWTWKSKESILFLRSDYQIWNRSLIILDLSPPPPTVRTSLSQLTITLSSPNHYFVLIFCSAFRFTTSSRYPPLIRPHVFFIYYVSVHCIL